MAVSKDDKAVGIVQSNDKFLRIKTLINHSAYELYCKLFLDPLHGGFSRQPDVINKELIQYKASVESLKDNGEIEESDFIAIYPPSEETYLRECKLHILHKLCVICVNRYPTIATAEESKDANKNRIDSTAKKNTIESSVKSPETIAGEENDNSVMYIKQLEKFQKCIHTNKLQTLVNSSQTEFNKKWKEITDLLTTLSYDITKVTYIKTMDNLDNYKTCHAAFMRSQTELLMSECENFLKLTQVNTFTLNTLLNNFNEALALENKTTKGLLNTPTKDEGIYQLKEMKDLKDSIEISANMLNITNDSLQVLLPDLKFWKDKNIEGDIIIIDEMLNKLSLQVDKQSRSVSDYFNTVSFDIVKIKEKVNCTDTGNVRYVKTPQPDVKDKKISLGFVSIGF